MVKLLIIVGVLFLSCQKQEVLVKRNLPIAEEQKFEITVVTENWKPYNYEENGEIKGSSTKIVKKVLEGVDLSFKIEVYPWARAYNMAQTKPNVLIYTIMRIPQREKLFKWVRPLGKANKTWLWKRKGNSSINIKTLEEAKKLFIGTNRDTMDHLWLKDNGFNHLEVTSKIESYVKMTYHKRIPLMAFNTSVYKEEIEKFGFNQDDFEKVIPLFETQPFMAFSMTTSDEIVKKYQDAYDRLILLK